MLIKTKLAVFKKAQFFFGIFFFRSYNHKAYTISKIKIKMRNLDKNDKELQDDVKVTKYLHVTKIEIYLIIWKN